MMNKIKSAIANSPIYVGMIFRMIGDYFFNLSFKMHISMNTEAGKKLKELDTAVKKIAQELQKLAPQMEAKPITVPVQQVQRSSGYSKLSDIIKGSGNGSNSEGSN